MTTPNEELIFKLRGQAYTTCRPDQLCDQAADLLQSQAERIGELEAEYLRALEAISKRNRERDTLRAERDTLRAEIAAIAATEPVAWLYTAHDGSVQAFTNEPPHRLKELCKPVVNRAIPPVQREPMSDGALIDAVANSIAKATRPMPANRLTELKLLMLTTAYEQGAGKGIQRRDCNPYAADTDEHAAWKLGYEEGLDKPMPAQDVNAEFVRVIQFAISQDSSASEFLNCWLHGDTGDWPEFTNAKGVK